MNKFKKGDRFVIKANQFTNPAFIGQRGVVTERTSDGDLYILLDEPVSPALYLTPKRHWVTIDTSLELEDNNL